MKKVVQEVKIEIKSLKKTQILVNIETEKFMDLSRNLRGKHDEDVREQRDTSAKENNKSQQKEMYRHKISRKSGKL